MEFLTTLEAVKDELGIDPEDESQDEYIQRMIGAASSAIAHYCDRTFGYKSVTEHLSGRDASSVYLSLTPIVGVESVLVNGFELGADGYAVDKSTGELRRVGGVWPWAGRTIHFIETARVAGSETRNITVKYTGGYVLPGEDDRDLPYDLELACIMTVADWHQSRGSPRDAVRLQVEQVGVSFGQNGAGGRAALPTTVKELIEPYRRVV